MRKNFKKALNKSSFVFFPVVFFFLSTTLAEYSLKPIIGPINTLMELAFLEEPIDFQKEAEDIFAKVTLEALPESNEKIQVPGELIPAHGERFGQVIIENANVNAPLYYGDSDRELTLGIGSYTGAYIPGAGGTILLAAHNNTFFHDLGLLTEGDKINIDTTYGKYTYEVTGYRVATETDTSAYDLLKDEENLIMYTCYPFDTLGLTPERYFVYAKYVSGPMLDIAK